MRSSKRTRRTGLIPLLGLLFFALFPVPEARAQTFTDADFVGGVVEIEPGVGIWVTQNGAIGGQTLTATLQTFRGASQFCGGGVATPGDTENLELTELITDTDTATGPPTGNSGVYRGFIPTTDGVIVLGDGTVQIRGGDRVQVGAAVDTLEVATLGRVDILELSEDFDPNQFAPAAPLPDDAGEIKLVTAGNSVLIRMIDQDQNCDPAVAETRAVTVTTALGDLETNFPIVETGIDTGIFLGVLPTRFALAATIDDGIAQVQSGINSITVTYTDIVIPNNSTPGVAESAVNATTLDVRGGVDGTIVLTGGNGGANVILGNNLLGNDLLSITVTDVELSGFIPGLDFQQGPGNDTVPVTIRSTTAGGVLIDEETFEIPESPVQPGIFNLVVSVRPATVGISNDQIVQTVPTGILQGTYIDALRASGQTQLQVVSLAINVAANQATAGIVPSIGGVGTGLTTPISVALDLTATENVTYTTVSLTDTDEDITSGPGNDTVVVTLRSRETLGGTIIDTETLELHEDFTTPGLFLRTLDVVVLRTGLHPPLSPRPFENRNDARIEVVPNGTVELSYLDPFRLDDGLLFQNTPAAATEVPVVARAAATVTFVDLTGPGSGPIVLGFDSTNTDKNRGYNSVTVEVNDLDENFHVGPGNDTVFVTLTSQFQANATTLDREVLEVPEDPVVEGRFRRTIPAGVAPLPVPGTATNETYNDEFLQVRIGQNVLISYLDKVSTDGINIVRTDPAAPAIVQGGDDGCVGSGILPPDVTNPDPRGLFTRVTIVDQDEDRNNGPGNDTVTVTLSSYDGVCTAAVGITQQAQGTRVDEETIEVPEDPVIPGRFDIQVPTSFGIFLNGVGVPDQRGFHDGVLQVFNDGGTGSIEYVYTDGIRSATEQIDIPCHQCSDGILVPTFVPPPCDVRIVSDNGGPFPPPGATDVIRLTPGDEVIIEVTSQNFNVSPGIDTLPISVTSSFGVGGPDLEDVLLYETAAGSGVFTGTIQTIFGDPITANGTLEVHGTSVITASFVDRLGRGCANNTDTATVEIDGAVRFLSNGGRHEVQGQDRFSLPNLLAELRVSNDVLGHRQSQRAGDPVFVVLQDDDLNLDPQVRDTISITIQSTRNDGVTPHDEIILDLVEVPNLPNLGNPFNTGVFIVDPAIFPNGRRTRLVVPGTAAVVDTILEVEAGGFIRVAYNDITVPRPANGPQVAPLFPEPRIDEMNIQAAQNAVVNLSAQDTGNVNFVRVGQNISIEVVDDSPLVAGAQTLLTGHDPNAIDTIRVSVTTGVVDQNGIQDRETIVLFETGLDTRTFRGFAPTRYANVAILGNGLLEMADTNATISTVTVEYVDPMPLEPDPINSNIRIVIDTIRTLTAADGTVTLVRQADVTNDDEFLLGDQLQVIVTDPDLAIAPEPASIPVTLTTPSGDVETLRADRIAAGTYQGFIKTMYMEVFLRENNLLEMTGGPVDNVTRGEPVTATYLDNLTADGRTDFIRTFVIRGFYTGTLHIVDSRLEETQVMRAATGATNQPQQDRFFIKLLDPDLDVPPARNTDYVTPTIGGGQIRIEVRNILTGALVDQESTSAAATLTELRRYDGEPRNNQGETIKGVFSNLGTQIRFLTAGTAPSGANFENNTIDVIGNDTITVTYIDVNTNGGHPELNRTFVVSSEVKADGTILVVDGATSGIELDLIVPMETASPGTIFIRVLEKDLDRDNLAPPAALADPLAPVPDTLRPGFNLGVLMVTDAGDRETFEFNNAGAGPRMTEANNPGEFRNFTNNQPGMPVVFGQPIPGNGVLELVQGDLITVSYTDEKNILPGFPTRRIDTANSTRRTSARIDILNPRTGRFQEPNRLEQFIIGEPFRVRITDLDLDLTAIPDTLQITVTTDNPVKPDLEVITLTEAMRVSLPISGGVFEGELPTDWHKLGNTAQRNGVLTLAGGDLITVTITDVDAASKIRTVTEIIPTAETYRANVRFEAGASGTNVAELPNGSVISIPSGTLRENTDVVFQLKYRTAYIDEFENRIPPPLNPQLVLSGDSGIVSYYEINPTGLVFKKPITIDLHVPQTVTVQGSLTMLNDAQRRALKILYFDGFEWQSANGAFLTRSDDNGVAQEFIRTTLNHFTVFTLGLDDREAPPLTGPIISEITPDKNPFSPNGDGINDFVVLRYFLGRAATITIRVLDSGGNVVRTLVDRVSKPAGFNTDVWDGTYLFSERTVPSGIYIIQVQATAEGARDEQSVGIGVLK